MMKSTARVVLVAFFGTIQFMLILGGVYYYADVLGYGDASRETVKGIALGAALLSLLWPAYMLMALRLTKPRMFKEHYTVTLALEGEIEVIDQFKTHHGLGFQVGDTGIAASKERPNIGLARLELFTHEGTQDETNSILCKWINTNRESLSSLRNINKTVMVNTFTLPKHAYSWFKFTPETIEAISMVSDLHLSVMTYKAIEKGS